LMMMMNVLPVRKQGEKHTRGIPVGEYE